MDHAIPFALWQDSSLWNLLPAAHEVNNSKRDRLPARQAVLDRRDAIVHAWSVLEKGLPRRFRREASRLAGAADLGDNWERPLFAAFSDAVEYTASLRGAERWAP